MWKLSPKRGWKNILESKAGNKDKTKYYMLIVLFTVVFFICMAFCFVRFVGLSRTYKVHSLAYRMDSIENSEKLFGVGGEFLDLFLIMITKRNLTTAGLFPMLIWLIPKEKFLRIKRLISKN